jgi:hypothetical protein
MSFWSSAKGPTLWQMAASFWKSRPPERLEGGDIPQLPYIPQAATAAHVQEILAFWRQHFKGGQGPRIGYTAEQLGDIIADPNYDLLIVIVADRIVGTIMAWPLGSWTRVGVGSADFGTSWIDMFCVDDAWRQRGVGRSLLFGIYALLFHKGREPSVFLKEGLPLRLPPICSSFYTWRRVAPNEPINCVTSWSRADFDDWIRPLHFKNVIYNSSPGHSEAAHQSLIVAYAAQSAWVVAAFTPAHQLHPADNAPLIWMTGCLVDGPVGAAEKKEAMLQLSAAAARHFDTHWVWVDGFHAPPDDRWTRDGMYHIYAFNWNPGVFLNGNPFIFF